jgi:hypothetical protein
VKNNADSLRAPIRWLQPTGTTAAIQLWPGPRARSIYHRTRPISSFIAIWPSADAASRLPDAATGHGRAFRLERPSSAAAKSVAKPAGGQLQLPPATTTTATTATPAVCCAATSSELLFAGDSASNSAVPALVASTAICCRKSAGIAAAESAATILAARSKLQRFIPAATAATATSTSASTSTAVYSPQCSFLFARPVRREAFSSVVISGYKPSSECGPDELCFGESTEVAAAPVAGIAIATAPVNTHLSSTAKRKLAAFAHYSSLGSTLATTAAVSTHSLTIDANT